MEALLSQTYRMITISYNCLFYYSAVNNKSKGIDDNIKMKTCQRLQLQAIVHMLRIKSLSRVTFLHHVCILDVYSVQ